MRLILAILCLCCLAAVPKPQLRLSVKTVNESPAVTLAWDASSGAAGYNLYWGRQSGAYTNVTLAGNLLSAMASNLVNGATYYFAATAYDSAGLESDYSAEVSYTVPMPPTNRVVQLWLLTNSTAGPPWSRSVIWQATNPAGNGFFRLAITNWVQ